MTQPVSLSTVQQVITYALQTFPTARKRIERAAQLVATNAVTRIDETTYLVRSATDANVSYAVAPDQCSCKDRERHPSQRCKHEWAVRILKAAERDEQEAAERLAELTAVCAFAAYDVVGAAERIAAGVR